MRLSGAFALALGLLAPAPVPVAAQGASETQEDARAQSIPTGASQFTFDQWEGPALPVWTYVPKGVDVAKSPILIVMPSPGEFNRLGRVGAQDFTADFERVSFGIDHGRRPIAGA